VDVFHTHFGIAGPWLVGIMARLADVHAGLSLLGYPDLVDLDPVYCMPAAIIEAKGLRKDWKALERRQA
jgi:geranylgeranyl transferase type-2 subunit beta